jgi:glucosylceramidase
VSVTQTTADLAQRLAPQPALRFTAGPPAAGVPVIAVNPNARFQNIIGVGGAMTDSSASLIESQLTPGKRIQLMRALFSTSGAHLGFLRLPLGGSDYTATGTPYTYDDLPAGQSDPTLAHFSIARDEADILPALRQARALNPSVYLEALPWTPPPWMKANDAFDNANHAGALLPADYPTFAQYLTDALLAYADHGVPINALVPANEPGAPTAYPGLDWNEPQEASFVSGDLAPALKSAGLAPAVFGWDLSWGPLGLTDPLLVQAATGALTGLAWHCYYGSPNVMTGVHAVAPHSLQLVDECSTGSSDIFPTSELLIASLRNWANGVGMWNLALDPQGGPVQPPNSGCTGCTGLATVDESTHGYTLSRDYYELAQLSHFVEPGAQRVSSPHFVAYRLPVGDRTLITPGLDDVAFVNPDGEKVLFVYNNSAAAIAFAVTSGGASVSDTIPAGATTTLTWR